MRLSDLLQTIQPVRITGSTSMEITGVNIDSRLIGTGHLFMAMRGTQTDGHAYIPAAIDKGAVAVLCEELPEELKAGITYIQVKDSEGRLTSTQSIRSNHGFAIHSQGVELPDFTVST